MHGMDLIRDLAPARAARSGRARAWLVVLCGAGVVLWRPSLQVHQAARRRLRRTLAAKD